MSRGFALFLLLGCAILEAGGDALVRRGMSAPAAVARAGFCLLGAIVLFTYAWLVNRPPWSFGSSIGVYVVLFFLMAQVMGWAAFGERPDLRIVLGGALIIAGGIVIAARA